jgi:hypothetical protein
MPIACPRCFRVSHNLNDMLNRYCGSCCIHWGDAPLAWTQPGTVAEFDCVGCGRHVFSVNHPDEVATCAVCRFICQQLEADTMTTVEALRMREHLTRCHKEQTQ